MGILLIFQRKELGGEEMNDREYINEIISIVAFFCCLLVLGAVFFAGCSFGYLDGFDEGFNKCKQVYDRVKLYKE